MFRLLIFFCVFFRLDDDGTEHRQATLTPVSLVRPSDPLLLPLHL